tara:strand:- start:50 stop:490 length:441 start_codon:yes stop_codon:yes gene_type:complete
MIKSFRGRMEDGGQQTIRLSTNDGLMGYIVKKFRAIPQNVGTQSCEGIFQIFTTERSTVPTTNATIDFTDPTLLGVVIARSTTDVGAYGSDDFWIFDNVKFNQDIFITYTDNQGTEEANYYLELEQVKLDLNEATVATLKDMRGRE